MSHHWSRVASFLGVDSLGAKRCRLCGCTVECDSSGVINDLLKVEDCNQMVIEQVDRETAYWQSWDSIPWEWDEETV